MVPLVSRVSVIARQRDFIIAALKVYHLFPGFFFIYDK